MLEHGLGDRFDDRVRIAWGEGYRLLGALMQRAGDIAVETRPSL
jgi:hypothetical protein